jgi:hypothetical protein
MFGLVSLNRHDYTCRVAVNVSADVVEHDNLVSRAVITSRDFHYDIDAAKAEIYQDVLK